MVLLRSRLFKFSSSQDSNFHEFFFALLIDEFAHFVSISDEELIRAQKILRLLNSPDSRFPNQLLELKMSILLRYRTKQVSRYPNFFVFLFGYRDPWDKKIAINSKMAFPQLLSQLDRFWVGFLSSPEQFGYRITKGQFEQYGYRDTIVHRKKPLFVLNIEVKFKNGIGSIM